MISTQGKTWAGITLLLLLGVPAQAQLASPLAPSGDQPGAGGNGRAQPGLAIPQGQAAVPAVPYQPAVIESPPAEPRSAAGDEATGPSSATTVQERAVPETGSAPASEFETYVSGIAGKPLRRFGADLLLPGARGFVAPPTVAIPDDYRLNPGDQLLLNLSGSVQASAVRLTVDNQGRIFVPKVGAITVGGIRFGDLRGVIGQAVGRQYRNFDLDVSVSRLHGITIYVAGFASHPGAYVVSSLSTLTNAVLAAGGPSAGGSFRSIQLKRDGRLISDFDLYDLLLRGDTRGDSALQNGDVIVIAPAGPQVAVTGSVNKEAIFELAPGETAADAVAYAGGVNTAADATRLLILDSLSQTGGWEQISAEKARQRVVRRGDIIRVLSNLGITRPVAQMPVLVTLSGEVARPGRYYVAPGTQLADVIAQAGGLTEHAFPYASVITRQSVRQQQQASFTRAIDSMELLLSTQPLVSANRAELAQPGNIALLRSVVQKLRQNQPTGRLVFDIPVTARSLPGDLILENNDAIEIPTRPVTVGVFGEVPSPASFAYRPGMTIGDAVHLAGGIRKQGDKHEIFVVRANGTVVAEGRGILRRQALPGDLVFVPIDANRGEFWARLRDITGSLFGGVAGAAAVKALAN